MVFKLQLDLPASPAMQHYSRSVDVLRFRSTRSATSWPDGLLSHTLPDHELRGKKRTLLGGQWLGFTVESCSYFHNGVLTAGGILLNGCRFLHTTSKKKDKLR